MAGFKKLFADAARLLYLGVGISDPGTIPRKIDLWKIATGEGWKLLNRSASGLHYKGKEAVRFDSREGDGLALYEELELSFCKIDLSVAAINQTVGLVFAAKSEKSYRLIAFEIRTTDAFGQSQLKLIVGANEKRAELELPSHLLEEWISIRIVIDPNFTAVFINGDNMPCLKIPASESNQSESQPNGKIGLWVAGNSEALFADLKYIQTRKRDFE